MRRGRADRETTAAAALVGNPRRHGATVLRCHKSRSRSRSRSSSSSSSINIGSINCRAL